MMSGIPALNQVYFYLTEGCNLACRHCWLAPEFDPEGDRHPVLPVGLLESAIRQARPLGLARVKLTGGEPLLHPDFVRLLEIVRREELAVAIETNGVLCTVELAAEIAKSPVRRVSVSMDAADAETHEWIRGVPGCFEQAVQAVRHLARADTPPQIIMSVMRRNVGQMRAMVHMAEDLGASSVKFNVVQPVARGEKLHRGNETLSVRELVALGRWVDTELAAATNLRLDFDYPLAFRPLATMSEGRASGVCRILNTIGVIPTGRYSLCGIGQNVPELVFGSVAEDPLDAVWREDGVLNRLREGLPGQLKGVCARCVMRHRCLGSCVAQNYYRSGDLMAPFWFCERAAAEGLFPESRLEPAPPEYVETVSSHVS
jgi:SynChlorMet cassette radical SAM/SPASM protein ScmF